MSYAYAKQPNEQWPETLYSFRLSANPEGPLVIAKWCGGREPVERYFIMHHGRGRCDCIGCARTGERGCKHMQMWAKVQNIVASQGLPNFFGCYYNYDTDTLYTPEDGEGVPWDNSWMEQFWKKS